MNEDFINGVFSNGVLGSEFFKALDDVTKNIQTSVHTVCEKWKNGEMISKDEEKYENGKKTLDVHRSKNIEDVGSDGNTADGCNKCENGCQKLKGTCNGCCQSNDELVNSLQAENQTLIEKNKSLTRQYESLEKENIELKKKLDRFKQLFESEF